MLSCIVRFYEYSKSELEISRVKERLGLVPNLAGGLYLPYWLSPSFDDLIILHRHITLVFLVHSILAFMRIYFTIYAKKTVEQLRYQQQEEMMLGRFTLTRTLKRSLMNSQ